VFSHHFSGIVSAASDSTKKSFPSQKSRDNSSFSNIQSEDLAKKMDAEETLKVYATHSRNQ